ncbi:MAG: hypothetical protein QOE14_1533 [Humisphaera sp.]|nr:hypothetical protein [Humisphaera sp.]
MTDWAPWIKFLDSVEQARSHLDFRPGEEIFYRGQSDVSWDVVPSLFRRPPNRTDDEFDQIEYDLFFEFEARARELHPMLLSQWDVLFFMRHHGAPTRLLDWTETLAVAVYFALHGYARDSGKQPCVWVLNPYRLNEQPNSFDTRDLVSPQYIGWDPNEDELYDYGELLIENEGFEFDLPVAMYAHQRVARMGAQRGYFTCHGDKYKPLNELCDDTVLRAVVIENDAVAPAYEFLRIAGIDEYQLFPDLDGLSRSLSAKYGFHAVADVLGASSQAREHKNRGEKTRGPRKRTKTKTKPTPKRAGGGATTKRRGGRG